MRIRVTTPTQRRNFVVALILLIITVAGTIVVTRAQPAAKLGGHALPMQAEEFWPMERAFSWSVDLPTAGPNEKLALRVRKSKTLAAYPDALTANVPSVKPGQLEREFGTNPQAYPGAKRSPATITIQIIDLASVAVASTSSGQNLRLIARLKLGGLTMGLNPADILLPAGTVVGGHAFEKETTWTGNELRLMSFQLYHVNSAMVPTNAIYYDVVLVRTGV